MSKINDGGQAFPRGALGMDADEPYGQQSGMSLRDWFAGQALAGLIDWTPPEEDGSLLDWTNKEAIRHRKAEWAYAQADAMLAVRERQP